MDPVSALQTLYTVAKMIYAAADGAKGNQKQCARLKGRIQVLETEIRRKERSIKVDHLSALPQLTEAFHVALDLIQRHSSKNFLRQMLDYKKTKGAFDQCNRLISDCVADLDLSFTMNIVAHEDQRAAEQDSVVYEKLSTKISRDPQKTKKLITADDSAQLLATMKALEQEVAALKLREKAYAYLLDQRQLQLDVDAGGRLKKIGSGAFGTVDTGTYHGSPVAVKELEMSVKASKVKKAAQREVALVAPLYHTHIIGMLGYVIEDGERAQLNLAGNDENKVTNAAAGAIKPLFQLLSNGSDGAKAKAARALLQLAWNNSESKASIAAAGAIKPLIQLLLSGSDGEKENAAAALMDLAVNAENKASIAAAGAIKPLIQLLSSGSDGAKAKAARVLLQLAWNNSENKASIAAAGAIKPLIRLVLSGSDCAKEQAAAALWTLAVNAENKASIAAAGAIKPLIQLLSSGSDGAKEQAAGALYNLAVNSENQVTIAAAGAIKPLIQLLSSGSDGAKEQAAAALQNLTVIAENKVSIAAAGAIKPLIQLLLNGSDVGKANAAAALENLAANVENKVSMAAAGAIKPLIQLLSSGSDRAKENAAGALYNLSVNAENKVSMAAAGAIKPLIQLLSSESEGAKEKAASALACLVLTSDRIRAQFVSEGGLQPLAALFKSSAGETKKCTATALDKIRQVSKFAHHVNRAAGGKAVLDSADKY